MKAASETRRAEHSAADDEAILGIAFSSSSPRPPSFFSPDGSGATPSTPLANPPPPPGAMRHVVPPSSGPHISSPSPPERSDVFVPSVASAAGTSVPRAYRTRWRTLRSTLDGRRGERACTAGAREPRRQQCNGASLLVSLEEERCSTANARTGSFQRALPQQRSQASAVGPATELARLRHRRAGFSLRKLGRMAAVNSAPFFRVAAFLREPRTTASSRLRTESRLAKAREGRRHELRRVAAAEGWVVLAASRRARNAPGGIIKGARCRLYDAKSARGALIKRARGAAAGIPSGR